ncbi:DUF6576 domain-containing protein [Ilumatobacter sp.]|uniref:DUF6576 domain-containing protein n=2 Tax=Ilumatobacter sp. TaxID=1967498 RepID=UPI003297B347
MPTGSGRRANGIRATCQPGPGYAQATHLRVACDVPTHDWRSDLLASASGRYRTTLMSQYFAALFSRRPNDGWFRVSRFDITTVDIMTALAIFTMFLWAASPNDIWPLFALISSEVRTGEIWRLVTWPIAEQPGFFQLISIAFFWSFGQQIEGLFGRTKFLGWVLAIAVVPAVVITGLGALDPGLDIGEFGLSPIFLAGIWVYAATYPNVRWFDVIPLWAVAAVFTLLQLLQLGGNRATGGILFILLTVATALSVGRSLGFATAWPIPHVPIGSGSGSGGIRRRKRSKPTPPSRPKRGGAGQRVVEGPWRRDPETSAPRAVPPSGPTPEDQAEMDDLLDKISAVGMDSMSTAEKQRLNELSKRLRNR